MHTHRKPPLAGDTHNNRTTSAFPGVTIWFTGLSGSGKTTLSMHLEAQLRTEGTHTIRLDGDSLRSGLNKGLDFSAADRMEGIRRAAEVAKMLNHNDLTVLAALISPLACDRDVARTIIGASNFFLVHVCTPLEICEQRDTKGLYRLARSGKISSFTGITAPYEEPTQAHVQIDTSMLSLDVCLSNILDALREFLNTKNENHPKKFDIPIQDIVPRASFSTLRGNTPAG